MVENETFGVPKQFMSNFMRIENGAAMKYFVISFAVLFFIFSLTLSSFDFWHHFLSLESWHFSIIVLFIIYFIYLSQKKKKVRQNSKEMLLIYSKSCLDNVLMIELIPI